MVAWVLWCGGVGLQCGGVGPTVWWCGPYGVVVWTHALWWSGPLLYSDMSPFLW